MSGEGDFRLRERERSNLRKYLQKGGFLFASPSCSDPKWNQAFQRELKATFPKGKLKTIPRTHPIFNIVHSVPKITLKSGGTTQLKGLFIDGRLALVFSPEGLNDVKNATGCCCCGGNEIRQSQLINVNILAYALAF